MCEALIPEGSSVCKRCTSYQKRKRKEVVVKEFFDYVGLKYDSHDKTVATECSKRRPDFVFDNGSFVLVVEVDEYQHRIYPCDCEYVRYVEIFQMFGGTPVVFLRYNPDGYKVGRKRIRADNEGRLGTLEKKIRQIQNVKLVKNPITVCYLYYDDYNGTMPIQSLHPFKGEVHELSKIE